MTKDERMRSLKDGDFYGFYRTSEAYLTLMSKRLHSEIMFGVFCRGGGCRGEMSMRWHILGERPVPRLEVFDDAWAVLADLPELIEWLRGKANSEPTAEEFSAFLMSIGFKEAPR